MTDLFLIIIGATSIVTSVASVMTAFQTYQLLKIADAMLGYLAAGRDLGGRQ